MGYIKEYYWKKTIEEIDKSEMHESIDREDFKKLAETFFEIGYSAAELEFANDDNIDLNTENGLS